jgi:hypothetical protein
VVLLIACHSILFKVVVTACEFVLGHAEDLPARSNLINIEFVPPDSPSDSMKVA